MLERVADLKDVRDLILAHLAASSGDEASDARVHARKVQAASESPYILCARDLSPSDAAHLNPAHCVGIVTQLGGPTSHTSIILHRGRSSHQRDPHGRVRTYGCFCGFRDHWRSRK